jgi:8-oxo-dGTP diphosphatase
MERHSIRIGVYLIIINENKILLCRRFNTGWEDGNYTLPSGHLDSNETIVDAVLREAKEEVGITLKKEDIKLVHTMHRISGPVDFFFIATNWGGEPKNMEPDTCDDVNWFDINSLPENTISSVKDAILNYQNGISFFEREM